MQDCLCQIARLGVEYQGQAGNTRILDFNPFIDTCYRVGRRLELMHFLLAQIFCSILIEQLINLRKKKTQAENLKFKKDLRNPVIDGRSNTVNGYFEQQIAKLLKSKIEKCICSDPNQSAQELDESGTQKLGNDLWHDSESIEAKLAAKQVVNEI